MPIRQSIIAVSDDWINSPQSLALPSAVLAGSTIVVAIASHQFAETSGNVNGVNDGSAYTNINAREDTNISTAWLDAWARYNVSAGAVTPTIAWKVSNASNRAAVVVMELSGVTTAPLDKTALGSATAGAVSVTTASTGVLSQADEMAILIAGGQVNGLALPAGSPFSVLQAYQMSGDNKGILVAAQTVAATTALTGTVNCNTAAQGILSLLLTFRLSAGGQRVRVLLENPDATPILGTSGWYGRIFNGASQVAQYTGGRVETTADGSDRAQLLVPATGLGLTNGNTVTVIGESDSYGILGECPGTVEAGSV